MLRFLLANIAWFVTAYEYGADGFRFDAVSTALYCHPTPTPTPNPDPNPDPNTTPDPDPTPDPTPNQALYRHRSLNGRGTFDSYHDYFGPACEVANPHPSPYPYP